MNIKFFNDINECDKVGGKGLNLAKLSTNGYNVPNGFVISTELFNKFLDSNDSKNKIKYLIENCNEDDEKELNNTSNKIIEILDKIEIPSTFEDEIIENYKKLNAKYVAVRSSATSEDGLSHAWAGQLETFLNINESNIIDAIRKCWYSIFSPRALFYRLKNADKSEISVAVIVQKMIQSDISGVAFSINPTTNEKSQIVIEAVLGIGETIVSGMVTPDSYTINKNNNEILSKKISEQKVQLIKTNTENELITVKDSNIQKLPDEKILELSSIVKNIEKLYGFPVDIEWAVEKDCLYILQCRPITTFKENSLFEKIKSTGNWKFYVSRKFNWFVENTEITSSLEEYQKEILGFELATQNYLCLNGDEYALESDFDILSEKLEKYFNNDIEFFDKFAKIEMDIVEEVKTYIDHLNNKDLKNIDFKELSKEFNTFNKLYIKSFVPGMTRPEDYLLYALREELLTSSFSNEEIDEIFAKVSTCPNYRPLAYSQEPLDLLKIAKKLKNNENVDELINKHVEKYAWIKGPVEMEDTAYTKNDYLERLNNLLETDIDDKIKNIENVRENNEIEYKNILQKYTFSVKAKKLIEAIRYFIFLRTYTTEYSDHLFFVGKHTIFKEISSRTNVNLQDLIMLDDKEILEILDNNGIVSKELTNMIDSRKVGFAMIWINSETKTVFGNESLELQSKVADIFKISDDPNEDINSDVIIGSIANKGKVRGIAKILEKYEDVYKVNKGDIIVASMTTPDLISAMEKASGFITDEGGITCHAAILSREFNVPCVVGTINATKTIKDGELIELDGYNGKIYKVK